MHITIWNAYWFNDTMYFFWSAAMRQPLYEKKYDMPVLATNMKKYSFKYGMSGVSLISTSIYGVRAKPAAIMTRPIITYTFLNRRMMARTCSWFSSAKGL